MPFLNKGCLALLFVFICNFFNTSSFAASKQASCPALLIVPESVDVRYWPSFDKRSVILVLDSSLAQLELLLKNWPFVWQKRVDSSGLLVLQTIPLENGFVSMRMSLAAKDKKKLEFTCQGKADASVFDAYRLMPVPEVMVSEKDWDKAEDYLLKSQYEESLVLYRRFLSQDRMRPFARLRMADVYLLMGDVPKAKMTYEQLRMDSEFGAAGVLSALSEIELSKRYQLTEPSIDKWIKRAQSSGANFETTYRAARVLSLLGRYKEALDSLKSVETQKIYLLKLRTLTDQLVFEWMTRLFLEERDLELAQFFTDYRGIVVGHTHSAYLGAMAAIAFLHIDLAEDAMAVMNSIHTEVPIVGVDMVRLVSLLESHKNSQAKEVIEELMPYVRDARQELVLRYQNQITSASSDKKKD